jgi:spermidine synthase
MSEQTLPQSNALDDVSVHVEERANGDLSVYISGDLQFDTRDEALYHELLVLPALSIIRNRRSAPIRLLICGGGDGLALREALRFPGVEHVDLVDCSETVVSLGRTRFSELNNHAFEDPRANTIIADAWDFLSRIRGGETESYSAVICDFTVPRRRGDSRVYSKEWYEALKSVLLPEGIISVNSMSPQGTPEAFACLMKTMQAAGLSAVPIRLCIPTFHEHGYGVWSFTLCGSDLRRSDLSAIECPVALRQANFSGLEKSAEFPPLHLESTPVNTLLRDALLPLLLNPGTGSLRLTESVEPTPNGMPFDLEPLIASIPILHPYHTRAMIDTLAEHVAPTIRGLDIRRLVDELMARAARLPERFRRELARVRDFIDCHVDNVDGWMNWSYRLFAILFIVITIANAMTPDAAFAKGGFGGGGHGFGMGGGSGIHAEAAAAPTHVTESGFRQSISANSATDLAGHTYQSEAFRYRPSYWGYGGYYGPGCWGYHPYGYGRYGYRDYGDHRVRRPAEPTKHAPQPKEEQHQSAFVVAKDLLVMDNGDIVVKLTDRAYLLVLEGHVSLMSNESQEPVVPLYPDPRLISAISDELNHQKSSLQHEVDVRSDWLTWVGWTESFIPAIKNDETEFKNLKHLSHSLETAIKRLGKTPTGAFKEEATSFGDVELFAGCVLNADSTVRFHLENGHWLILNRDKVHVDSMSLTTQAPTGLGRVLPGIISRRAIETASDLKALDRQLRDLENDRASLVNDRKDYDSIYSQSGYDGNYEVDYGTEEISVSEAIKRTVNDLDNNQKDMLDATAIHAKLESESLTLSRAAEVYGNR